MVTGAALFVAGFTVVFVVHDGDVQPARRQQLIGHQDALLRVLGVVVIALGLLFIGVLPGSGRMAKPSWRPDRRTGRGTGAGRDLRDRLDAVHEPDAGRGDRAGHR